METFEVTNDSTIYRLRVSDEHLGRRFWLAESGWRSNCGEWVALNADNTSIAWSYLAEKMPVMGSRPGDKEGWIMAFAKAGLKVFG